MGCDIGDYLAIADTYHIGAPCFFILKPCPDLHTAIVTYICLACEHVQHAQLSEAELPHLLLRA